VAQKEVWRVERAGQANGGALATAGGLVFQGTGSGQFTALDAATGKELWSQPTQTGVIAAPISYTIDDEQYVAILVGTGGSWAMIGGDSNMKGYALPNVSRLLVYKLGGDVQLPAAPPMQRPPLDPPAATASAELVGRGAPLYETWCGTCHGAGVIGVGLLPDLRRSPLLRAPEQFEQVVLGGVRKAQGMASFEAVMDQQDVAGILAYITLRANQDAAAAVPPAAPASDR
jgi:mono/diheme cytochrome c family protein